MKRLFTFFATLMSLAASQAQDAFYIYRNDGEFDGFFYEDVVRMGVSKYDLDSIEHEEYVVQEVETADSIYRIPLSVIDSVGFQQPEVIFNPRVKDIGEQRLYDYMKDFYAGQDLSVFFRLNADTPSDLVPKEGDVLINFSDPRIRYSTQMEEDFSGFACKVKSISRYNEYSQWAVNCEPLTDLSDIFVQLISVEKIGYDETGNVKRRFAGFDYDDKSHRFTRRQASGSGSVSIIDLSASLKREADWGSANADLTLKFGMDMTYNISWRRIYFKQGRTFDFSVTPSATMKASKDFEAEIVGIPEALSAIKFPSIAPLFETRPFPKMFIRGGGELGVKLSLPTVGYKYHESLSFDSDKILFWRYNMFDGSTGATSPNSELFNTGDVELSLSGFVQFGTKFTAGVWTNDWFSRIFSAYIGLELFVGPKIDGSLSLSMARLLQQGAYESLSGSKISFHPISLDLAAKASMRLFYKDPDETTFFEGSKQFGSYDLYLFPAFKDTKVTYNSKNGLVSCSTNAENSVFWQSNLGFGAYLDNQLVEASEFPIRCGFGLPAKPYNSSFSQLTPGRYQIMPLIRTAGIDLPVRSQAQEVLVTPYLNVTPKDLHFTFKGGEGNILAQTNSKNLVTGGESGVWEGEVLENLITIKAEKNNSIFPRKRDIIITAGSLVGYSRDTIRFEQDGNNGECIKNVFVAYESSISTRVVDDNKQSHTGGIPCTATREGDIITIRGHYSSGYDAREWEGNTLAGNIDESVELVIDASNVNTSGVYGTYGKVVSGKFIIKDSSTVPIIDTGEMKQTEYGTATSYNEIVIGSMELTENLQFNHNDVHTYESTGNPITIYHKSTYPGEEDQIHTENEGKGNVRIVVNWRDPFSDD